MDSVMPVAACASVAGVDIGVLTETVPSCLVDSVIDETGCRERRCRLLPSRLVMYFVLGLSLFHASDGFCPPGYRAVWNVLIGQWVVGCRRVVSASALTQARQRLGVAPLRLLFDRVRGIPSAARSSSSVFGLRLVAWDATTLAAPGNAQTLAAFGCHGQSRTLSDKPLDSYQRRLGTTPRVRLMMLIDCATHAVIDAVFEGIVGCSEQSLAQRLTPALRPGMLLLADRLFLCHDLWATTAATGAQLLWRVKSNTYLEPVQPLPDGSYLALLPTKTEMTRLHNARQRGCHGWTARTGQLLRIVEYTVTITSSDTTVRHERFRLATTLLEPQQTPAGDLAALYHQRWEAETSYSFLKPRLIGSDTLRSRTPEGIEQEIYAFLIIYQTLCILRADAAATADIDPHQVSFLITLRAARATAASAHHNRQHTIIAILHQPALTRRPRAAPRLLRAKAAKYDSRPKDQPAATTTITYTIEISPPSRNALT